MRNKVLPALLLLATSLVLCLAGCANDSCDCDDGGSSGKGGTSIGSDCPFVGRWQYSASGTTMDLYLTLGSDGEWSYGNDQMFGTWTWDDDRTATLTYNGQETKATLNSSETRLTWSSISFVKAASSSDSGSYYY